MHSVIGPLDGRRARRKRCDACVKRRIKCHGGIPCQNCTRTQQACKIPTKPTTFAPTFVGMTTKDRMKTDERTSMPREPMGLPLLRSPVQRICDTNIPYFFTSFLAMNSFTNTRVPVIPDLSNMMKDAPALRAAICAIAACHRVQQRPVTMSMKDEKREILFTLQSYDESVRYVKHLISSNTFTEDVSASWTTFLLGLFELMRDPTGTQWLSHFLYGSCTLLRLQTPDSLSGPGSRNSRRRTFFLGTRIFEITRSLLYSSPTFLWEPEWMAAVERLWDGENLAQWHPKEALFDMLPQFSELSIRVIQFCLNAEQLSTESRLSLTHSLAEEGFSLQKKLKNWRAEAENWNSLAHTDTELMIGFAYYHGISIYLSGTYDYHVHWNLPGAPQAPILSPTEIDWHVSTILLLGRDLLARGISGIFLLFPLRVAGARAVDMVLRSNILYLLRITSKRGFTVANAIQNDLSQLWSSRDM